MAFSRIPMVWPWKNVLPRRGRGVAAMAARLYRQERREIGDAAELVRCLRQAAAMMPPQATR